MSYKDTEQFVRDRYRMCYSNEFCTTCPIYLELGHGKKPTVCHNFRLLSDNAEQYVRLVYDWAQENPE